MSVKKSFKNKSIDETNALLTAIFTNKIIDLKQIGITITKSGLEKYIASHGIN
ncbi:MAG: hypothetical protein PHU36_08645 [Syntrophomonadaceae bacterium]|nr:hypothetical protein [Syntrophomonadaceae bacterium]